MRIVGVDPSIRKGQAYSLFDVKNNMWNKQSLVQYGKLESMIQWLNFLAVADPDLVLIEDQYLAKNYKTAKELTLVSGKLAGVAEMMKVAVRFVNVATWQSRLGIVGIGAKMNPTQRKKVKSETLILLAGRFVDLKDDDIAAAILIPWAMRFEL